MRPLTHKGKLQLMADSERLWEHVKPKLKKLPKTNGQTSMRIGGGMRVIRMRPISKKEGIVYRVTYAFKDGASRNPIEHFVDFDESGRKVNWD